MADKVKIYEIAKRIGIPSRELMSICRRAGFAKITHHSNAVDAELAEEIRKAAIRLYRPVEPPAAKKARPAKKPPKAEKPEAAAVKKKPQVAAKEEPAAKEKPAAKEEPAAKKKPAAKEKARPRGAKAPSAAEGAKPASGKGKGGRSVVAGTRARDVWAEARRAARQQEVVEAAAGDGAGGATEAPAVPVEPGRPRRRQGRPGRKAPQTDGAPSRTRTVVFKQLRKTPVVTKREASIELTPPVTVRDLSERLGVSASVIIRRLMTEHQVRASINEVLEVEPAELIGLDYGVEITFKAPKTADEMLRDLIPQDRPEDLRPRQPIIALLGHVDHGKTSILDRVRHTEVAGTEDGGITQDLGAWQIERGGHRLTFIDTPGHEAFTAMRAHGAQITDIVVLVVAADDGVMPQTEEAISHARAAGVPIVVALNKIDKPDANPMRVMQQLAGQELNPEEWGGEVGCMQVSALKGEGIEELLERIVLEAELHELKANPAARGTGAVLEARVVQGLGVVASAIVRNGTLRPGDTIVCGSAWGRIRSLINEQGEELAEAGPSSAVAISGLDRLPAAGDTFVVVEDPETARDIAQQRMDQEQQERLQRRVHVTLENLYESLAAGREKQLRVVIKADVKGSLEPLVNSFKRVGTEEVSVKVLHEGVGSVNTSDVLLADASDAVILAFRVGTETRAERLAKDTGVEVRYYRVIYEVIQEVRDALEGLLEPEFREEKLGEAEVRQTFKISRVGTIAGCYVRDGLIRRGARVRLVRDGVVVHEGAIATLRREKNDHREVETGYECGIRLEGYNDVQLGDSIQCFTVMEVKRVLS